MKTARDPRHLERIGIMQELYSWQFNPSQRFENPIAKEIASKIKKVDKLISEAAPTWPLDKINRIDLAILRLAVYELAIEPKAPPRVIIDEAVEIAKEFGSDASPGFINGALGKLIINQNIET